jgi:hypothetical protein
MPIPNVGDFIQYARLMNGVCDHCGRILPRPDSEKRHVCKTQSTAGELYRDDERLPPSERERP